jgi:hypothetical protein
MSPPPPPVYDLARRLLADDPAGVEPPRDEAERLARAVARLRAPLVKLIGAAGFASLLGRALALAGRRAPALEGLAVQPGGALGGFDLGPQDPATADATRRGGEALVAELLGLLITFVGRPLTLSLVREAWPDAPVEGASPNIEEQP